MQRGAAHHGGCGSTPWVAVPPPLWGQTLAIRRDLGLSPRIAKLPTDRPVISRAGHMTGDAATISQGVRKKSKKKPLLVCVSKCYTTHGMPRIPKHVWPYGRPRSLEHEGLEGSSPERNFTTAHHKTRAGAPVKRHVLPCRSVPPQARPMHVA